MRKCVPSPDVSSSTPRNLSNSTALCPPSTVNREAFSALPAAPSAIAARATLVNRFTAFGALILAKSPNFFPAPAQPYLVQLHHTGLGGAEEKTPSKNTIKCLLATTKNPIYSLLATKQNSGKHAELATGGKRSEQPNGNPLGPTLGLGFRDQD